VTSAATSAPQIRFGDVEQRIHAAVRAVAATQQDPLDPFRGLYISDADAVALAGADRAADGADSDQALAGVAARLRLDPLDTALLAFCAAPELDARYGRLIAYLHDDVTRRLPTPRLAARLLGGDGLAAREVLRRFASSARLCSCGAVRLLESEPGVALADRPAKLDERLAAHLIGADLAPPAEALAPARARELLVPVPARDPGRPDAVEMLRRLLASAPGAPVIACGADAPEILAWAAARPVLLLDARDAADRAVLGSARMRCMLEDAELVLELPAASSPEERERARAACDRADRRVLACARRARDVAAIGAAAALIVDVPPASPAERRELWTASVAADADAFDEVVPKFRLSIGQIARAARIAELAACARGADAPSAADLERGAREASRTELGELATLLPGRRDWSDLVLPAPQQEELRSISAYLRHRDRVLVEWGYADAVAGQGLTALFAGESGTGKTLAAQVIATDLGVDAFRVDLATVVSKYIGETERNLDRIFDAAEGSNAILFFDEADALFGKRSEVKDAHDRYANIEVSYLLQRMEGYTGAVLLATNYRRNIDEAFLRRLDFAVEFPLPDVADRARIWRRLLPDAAPVAADVDPDALAARFELSGGSIRNCSVAAAFMAADAGGAIEMAQLVRAVGAEYRKNGRLALGNEFASR
jgi:hypothetical protein